jgi:transposase-like protein
MEMQGRLVRDVEAAREEIREIVKAQLRGAALRLVQDLFRQEVETLCGKPYARKRRAWHLRGGSELGSINLEGQRMRVRRPRVRDGEREVPLESYGALQEYDVLCEEVARRMVRGVSTRNYEGVIQELEGGLGLSRSSVSRAFHQASRKDLDLINGQDLSKEAWAALLVDGKEFQGTHIVVALGVTEQGRKVLLGLREGATENAEVVRDLVVSIRDRGFDPAGSFLTVLDGAKALKKAIREVFAERAEIQRCCEHKKRNVLSYLPDSHHREARRRLKAAWGMTSYADARREMGKVVAWLGEISVAAASSLEEGLEETLTVHRLGLSGPLRERFRTTNLLESVLASVELETRRVTNWKTGKGQAMRWTASALRFHETKFRRLIGHAQMPVLVAALKRKGVDVRRKVG